MRKTPAALLLFLMTASAFIPAACSHIDETDRLTVINVVEKDTITVPDTISPDTTKTDTIAPFDPFTPQGRHVLIEDFTGQDCVNCPNATDLIAQMQEMYGHDRIIAVGIHSGPLGVKPDKTPEGLATSLGDTYYNHWHIEMQPYGVINRSDGTLSTDWWAAKVNWDLSEELPAPSVNIWVEATIGTGRKATFTVTVPAFEAMKGKLQLWVVEDGIVAFQKMPDGTTNHEYVHNHVLRDAVNGSWGEDITLEAGETRQFSYTYDIPAQWNTKNLRAVAFAYNDERVVQVTSAALKEKQ